MQFKQVLLMFSALATIAYSFPAGAETNSNSTTDFAQNGSIATDAIEYKHPLTVNVEDNNTKSVVVEFVFNSYNGNSIIESNGTDKYKYIHDSSPSKKIRTKYPIETDKENSEVLNPETAEGQQVSEPKFHSSQTSKNFQMKAEPSLIPEEVSPLSERWPKFYYDAFNPIQAFPELQYDRRNKINAPKVQSRIADTYLPFYEKERKEQISVAGPPLSPLSLYDREFIVPIFE